MPTPCWAGCPRRLRHTPPWVTHARHRQALEAARARLADAADTLHVALPADFLAIDVQAALAALGEITGQTAPDDVINEIFARFCIGK